jgi:hypothetical protein
MSMESLNCPFLELLTRTISSFNPNVMSYQYQVIDIVIYQASRKKRSIITVHFPGALLFFPSNSLMHPQ